MSTSRRRDLLPAATAVLALLIAVLLIAPWGEFPVNDDWHFAHVARNFAERGVLAIDLPSSTSIVGQSIIAWPVIHFLGFSFLQLRLLTLACSVVIIFEIDYLLRLGEGERRTRLLTLLLLVANPFFLYFSTSFMTEHYSLLVALLSACLWFRGKKEGALGLLILSAAIAGYAFWIRQLSALVFPAALLAEFVVKRERFTRHEIVLRVSAVVVWLAGVGSFFVWATLHGSQTQQASDALSRIKSPAPMVLFLELGIFVFYVTFFGLPFLVAWLRYERPTSRSLMIPGLLVISAILAIHFGDFDGSPRSNIHAVFPFLHNVVNQYGVGPILLTDVYIENSPVRPHAPAFPWIIIELALISVSVGWSRVLATAKNTQNEIALFGICFALLNYAAVGLSFVTAIFDRYHYLGIVGLTLTLAATLPTSRMQTFSRAAIVWIVVLGVLSTLALHDHFRWQAARAELAHEAEQRGISPSQVDAGYEINGWNDIENRGRSAGCGAKEFWFCAARPYRIGTTKQAGDSVLIAKRIRWWLLPFPNLLLLKRG